MNSKRTHSPHISRRTVAKATVWSAPVVAIASAAPAFASSCPISVDPGCGIFCGKDSRGQHIFELPLTITNSGSSPVNVSFTGPTGWVLEDGGNVTAEAGTKSYTLRGTAPGEAQAGPKTFSWSTGSNTGSFVANFVNQGK